MKLFNNEAPSETRTSCILFFKPYFRTRSSSSFLFET
nr:MAG TPA: hypothetical protein [Caudoviricetes sp.]